MFNATQLISFCHAKLNLPLPNFIFSFQSNGQIHQSDVNLELEVDAKAVKKEHDKDTSLLEIELKELQERYLHMSLKYAEVEAQREELVLKLKAVKPGKSWFS